MTEIIIAYVVGVVINLGIITSLKTEESIAVRLICAPFSWFFFGYMIGWLFNDISELNNKQQ